MNAQLDAVWVTPMGAGGLAGANYDVEDIDVERMERVAAFHRAVVKAIPSDARCVLSFDEGYYVLRLVPSETAPATFRAAQATRLCIEMTDIIYMAASDCKHNAAAAIPHPLGSVVRAPQVIPILRAMQCYRGKPGLTVEFRSDGQVRALPQVAPEDFTAGARVRVTCMPLDAVPVTGLVRDRRDGRLALCLQDIAGEVSLPGGWVWRTIRDALELEMVVSGTLLREGKAMRLDRDAMLYVPDGEVAKSSVPTTNSGSSKGGK